MKSIWAQFWALCGRMIIDSVDFQFAPTVVKTEISFFFMHLPCKNILFYLFFSFFLYLCKNKKKVK
ncbi:hypothetical protein D0T57_00650 [Dysgonomonas sp. 511]|nr:hypothetical protein [Dysgonomonas sp. 511]